MFKVDSRRLSALMLRKCLTIRELSRKAKLSEMTTAKFLRGARANGRTLGKLAAALNVDAEELILKETPP